LNQSLERLINLLQEQKKILLNMLKQSQEIRAIVVGASEERLDGAVRKNLTMIREMKAMEKKRMELLPTVAEELGLKQSGPALTDIINRLSPKERSIMQALQNELKAGFIELSELNADNQELISEHLDYAEVVLDYLAAEDDPLNNFYGNDGNAAPDGTRAAAFFDTDA